MPDGAIQFANTSTSKGAKATGPTAGTAVATITPSEGLYDIECWLSISGTSVVAVESNNLQLKFGSAVLVDLLPYASSTSGTTNGVGPYKVRVMCDGVNAVTANAIASATATAVYAASLVATRIGP